MIFLLLASGAFVLIVWLLAAPLVVQLDTRIPCLTIEWMWIFRWIWRPKTEAPASPKKDTRKPRKKQEKKRPRKRPVEWIMRKMVKSIRVIGTFRVQKLEIALDTGDPVKTAKMYPFNYYPYPPGKKVYINFAGENYLFLRITNRPWRILFAWFR